VLLEIQLPRKAATGYIWCEATTSNDKANQKSIVQIGDGDFVHDAVSKKGMVGGSGNQIIRYVGTSQGTTVLTLELRRPLVKNGGVIDSYTITNFNDNSVTKITPTGTMTTYSGTGTQPYGIAFDGTNMWTANYGGNSVTKISPTGTMTTYTGTGSNPAAIAFDGTNMWTANMEGNNVTKVLVNRGY